MDSFSKTVVAILVSLAASLAGISHCNSAPSYQEGSTDHGSLKHVKGVWVLELSGSPEERGAAAGKLVGEQIRWLLPRYLEATLGQDSLPSKAVALVRRYEKYIPEAHLAQLGALAKSAGVDRDTLLAVNLAPEVFSSLGCSCLAAQTGDGGTLLGRNLDWHGGKYLSELGLVVVEQGSGHAFASVTWPGLVGVVTGMNDRGLSVANLVVFRTGQGAQPGMPVLFGLREVLEDTGKVDEGSMMIREFSRSVCQNYALADPQSAAVLETCPDTLRVRSPKNGVLAVANLHNEDKRTRSNSRYAKMTRAAKSGKLDIEKLKAILGEVALGDLNVQAVIFEPGSRTLHLSISSVPAAKGTWRQLSIPFQ